MAIIGDVGGHRGLLHQVLSRLGVDPDHGTIPDDTCVVQVGDLVGGDPDDAGLVADVDRLMDRNPGRWIQLVGNWEARHIGGPVFGHRRRDRVPLPDAAVTRLEVWWKEGRMVVAAAVESQNGDAALVTHAGVTREFWLRHLMAEPDAQSCARQLNDLAFTGREVVFRPGSMLGEATATEPPGPVWAAAGTEVWPSWAGHTMPFDQVHGHTSPYLFGGRRWDPGVPPRLRGQVTLHHRQRHVWWTNGDHRIIGIDAGLGMRPRGVGLVPLVLPGTFVTIPSSTASRWAR